MTATLDTKARRLFNRITSRDGFTRTVTDAAWEDFKVRYPRTYESLLQDVRQGKGKDDD